MINMGELDDFEENSVEPTEELLEAIRILNDAQDKDYAQKLSYRTNG